jgi:hypothetical protein
MIVQNFRKKPVVIQAVQLTNDNVLEAFRWCDAMEWSTDPAELKIKTLEGVMTASEGDYIICGVSGEFYPCKPDIFAKTYDVGPDTAVLAERVEAVVQEFYGQSMTEDEGFIAPDFFGMAREILNLRAERDQARAERDALRTEAIMARIRGGPSPAAGFTAAGIARLAAAEADGHAFAGDRR